MPRSPAQKQWTKFYLNEWMEHRGLNQAQLAQRAGLSAGMVSEVLAGNLIGSPETLEKLASALDITPGMLLDARPIPGYKLVRRWVREDQYDIAVRHLDFVLDSRRLQ